MIVVCSRDGVKLVRILSSWSTNGRLRRFGVFGMPTNRSFWSVLVSEFFAFSYAYANALTVGEYDDITRSSVVCGGTRLES